MELIENVHVCLNLPDLSEKTSLVRGIYNYYHYTCDGVDDRGWGCGYRTLQTICSWVHYELNINASFKEYPERKTGPVPTIQEIQKALRTMGDKPDSFVGSREWIGSVEVAMCIDFFYNVLCKILHLKSGSELKETVNEFHRHFDCFGSPVMMGGDRDCSSKGIMGICSTSEESYLLVVDPHYSGRSTTKETLQILEFVKWYPLSSFMESSFYNLCFPQLKSVMK
ncbi:ufm1-specific protease 1-like [Tachypleus tridentatus]|uniref:ufm1-specific protease 1-like n=1 Tax=Tachypleus tridentatus TaxID=6853 RepID=UPI003FD1D8E3